MAMPNRSKFLSPFVTDVLNLPVALASTRTRYFRHDGRWIFPVDSCTGYDLRLNEEIKKAPQKLSFAAFLQGV